ncbi:MAG: hypothetical protein ABJA02_09380 [Acidobacteriota bacterium]
MMDLWVVGENDESGSNPTYDFHRERSASSPFNECQTYFWCLQKFFNCSDRFHTLKLVEVVDPSQNGCGYPAPAFFVRSFSLFVRAETINKYAMPPYVSKNFLYRFIAAHSIADERVTTR